MAMVKASDGVALYTEAHGEGMPIVLSCGLCTTCEIFRPQVEPLAEAGARVILWDYRGHGRSESPDDPAAYSLDHVLDDLGRVLDWAAPGEAAVVGGSSFGGLASLHFAHRNPARTRALLLIGAGPGFKNPDALKRWKALNERTLSFIQERGLAAFVASRASETLIGRRPELPAAKTAARSIADQNPVGLEHFIRQIITPVTPIIDELTEIDVPAQVVVGEKDEAYLPAADLMTARLPRAQRETIPGGGHIVTIDSSDAFNTVAVRFLRQIAAD
jgi:2-succinyl-6-hydroxy-2,4-cyclohexadiene-1-carboxylate synthase